MKSPYFVPPFASALLLALSAPDAAQGRARSSVSSGRTGILLRGTTSDAPVGRILKENDENNKDKNKEKNADAPSVNAETSSVKDMGDDCWGWKSEWTDDEYAPCWDGTYDFTLDPEAPPARCNKHDCGDKTDDWTDVCDLWCDEYGEMTNVPTGTPTSKPTARPTTSPTESPTKAPTDKPTTHPTLAPTGVANAKPAQVPTAAPLPVPAPLPADLVELRLPTLLIEFAFPQNVNRRDRRGLVSYDSSELERITIEQIEDALNELTGGDVTTLTSFDKIGYYEKDGFYLASYALAGAARYKFSESTSLPSQSEIREFISEALVSDDFIAAFTQSKDPVLASLSEIILPETTVPETVPETFPDFEVQEVESETEAETEAEAKLKAQAETAPAPEAGDQDSVPNGVIAGVAVVAVALTLAMVVVVFIRRQPSSKNAQERPRTPLSKKTDHSSPHSKGTQGIEWDDASEGASKGIVGDASVSYSIDSLRSGGDFRADHDLKRELSLDSEGWGEREDNVVVDVSRRVKDDEEDEDDNIPSWAKDSKPDEFVW